MTGMEPAWSVASSKSDQRIRSSRRSLSHHRRQTVPSVGEVSVASFTCEDDVLIQSCTGDPADGARLNTTAPGQFTVTATALDAAGNATAAKVTYTVRKPLVLNTQYAYVTNHRSATVSVVDVPRR